MNAKLTNIQLPLELLIESARRLAQHGEYKLAETLLRWALAGEENNPSSRRWLEFVLEAQSKYEEAYRVHMRMEAGYATRGLN